jgi:hypothetical protein
MANSSHTSTGSELNKLPVSPFLHNMALSGHAMSGLIDAMMHSVGNVHAVRPAESGADVYLGEVRHTTDGWEMIGTDNEKVKLCDSPTDDMLVQAALGHACLPAHVDTCALEVETAPIHAFIDNDHVQAESCVLTPEMLMEIHAGAGASVPEEGSDTVWLAELETLADMGFTDRSVLIPLLETHVKTPRSVGLMASGSSKWHAAHVAGMQNVVGVLLMSTSTIATLNATAPVSNDVEA